MRFPSTSVHAARATATQPDRQRVAREIGRSASVSPMRCGPLPADSGHGHALLLQRAQSSSSAGRSVRVMKFRVG
jgi:hypothetical protein